MNYLAHGYRYTDRPYVLAGTALPDWLRASDGRYRFRPGVLPPGREDGSPLAELSRGIARHLRDDVLFHRAHAFEATVTTITARLRSRFPDRPYLRAHFLAHLLTELLLDATLVEQNPGILERYYDALERVELEAVEQIVVGAFGQSPPRFLDRVKRFRRERFIEDYQRDEGLLRRIEQVVARVGLPPLPEGLQDVLGPARAIVADRADGLLAITGP